MNHAARLPCRGHAFNFIGPYKFVVLGVAHILF